MFTIGGPGRPSHRHCRNGLLEFTLCHEFTGNTLTYPVCTRKRHRDGNSWHASIEVQLLPQGRDSSWLHGGWNNHAHLRNQQSVTTGWCLAKEHPGFLAAHSPIMHCIWMEREVWSEICSPSYACRYCPLFDTRHIFPNWSTQEYFSNLHKSVLCINTVECSPLLCDPSLLCPLCKTYFPGTLPKSPSTSLSSPLIWVDFLYNLSSSHHLWI